MTNIYDSADDVDTLIERSHALRLIARMAREHGHIARVVGRETAPGVRTPDHVLVCSPDGEVLVTRTATRLVTWLGY
jgi:hypothetical protein